MKKLIILTLGFFQFSIALSNPYDDPEIVNNLKKQYIQETKMLNSDFNRIFSFFGNDAPKSVPTSYANATKY